MFAHLTVSKQQMIDQRFFSQTKTLRLFGEKNRNTCCLKYRAFTFQRFSKIYKVLLSTIHCCSSVLLEFLTTTYLCESNLKQPRLFRVYFGKFRAVWFAVYKYGGTNTVDKKPQWYLPMHALLKEHLITDYSSKLGPCKGSQA